jgi:hypothetical protein
VAGAGSKKFLEPAPTLAFSHFSNSLATPFGTPDCPKEHVESNHRAEVTIIALLKHAMSHLACTSIGFSKFSHNMHQSNYIEFIGHDMYIGCNTSAT